MKILYGVQGTGNGHISRASAMSEQLERHPNLEITWLLSGREKELGCGGIQNFEWREGLTFATRNGGIHVLDTIKKISLRKFWDDVKKLDLEPYDLVISDYEPVISHAARRKGVHVTGIGHQYAFCYKVPTKGENFIAKTIMQNFAPADRCIGLHWHHYDAPILPPIIDINLPETLPIVSTNKVIVYLPFENLKKIEELLTPLKNFDFYIYHPQVENADAGHLHTRTISRLGFKQDLLTTGSVI